MVGSEPEQTMGRALLPWLHTVLAHPLSRNHCSLQALRGNFFFLILFCFTYINFLFVNSICMNLINFLFKMYDLIEVFVTPPKKKRTYEQVCGNKFKLILILNVSL